MKAFEVNFDGLVGPTHNYAGLAFGNVASMENARQVSHPKLAAKQGLKKMQRLHELGLKQALIPPQERPNLPLLRTLGFRGTDAEILAKTYDASPDLFLAYYSSSSMWTANAATVCPSSDSTDHKVHFTISNLTSHLHRAQEAPFTHALFKKIFSDERFFSVHPPLFSNKALGDEGAANHNRFCRKHGEPGFQLFVYGHSGFNIQDAQLYRYPPRQTLEASQAVMRLHQLHSDKSWLVKQNRQAINTGIFHNDVISVVNENVFIYHEHAFEDTEAVIRLLEEKIDFPMFFIPVKNAEISLEEAVQSYLFNSQVLTLETGDMIIMAPVESKEMKKAHQVLSRILEQDNPIKKIEYVDCRQSMQNGGGPACLRLRVVLTEEELNHCHHGVFLDDTLFHTLDQWIDKHYREQITPKDLKDPNLLLESRTALDELTKILKLGSLYAFQRAY